jgi:hypothetical protein
MFGHSAMSESPWGFVTLIPELDLTGSKALAWNLDNRSAAWALAARNTIWNISVRPTDWTL